jgi:hypothetical protein
VSWKHLLVAPPTSTRNKTVVQQHLTPTFRCPQICLLKVKQHYSWLFSLFEDWTAGVIGTQIAQSESGKSRRWNLIFLKS